VASDINQEGYWSEMTISHEHSNSQWTSRSMNKHSNRKKNNLKNIQKSGQTKRWVIVFILRGNVFRYLHFKDAEQLPSEVTSRRMVKTYPRSTEVPVIHYSMKVNLQTLAGTLVYG
jgi:hypothetical protein